MHTGISAPDGRVKMFELKLCIVCCRMILLNDEKYQKVYLPTCEGFVFAHQECPPDKFFQELPSPYGSHE